MLLTISGLPGAGTSTVAKQAAHALGVERVDGGTVFRAMAAEHGLDVSAFSKLAESDPEYDLELDQRLAVRARRGDVVLESRLAAWIARNEGLSATTIWIDADESERARRVAERDGGTVDDALSANRAREASERRRYQVYYGIDLDDRSVYDAVLDSTATPAQDLVKSILALVSQ